MTLKFLKFSFLIFLYLNIESYYCYNLEDSQLVDDCGYDLMIGDGKPLISGGSETRHKEAPW
jgi:hypothetical protein